MLYFTYALDILLLFAVPIFLGIFLVRKYDLEGRWWWIGAIVYGLSQLILWPLQNYVLNPYLNGLSLSGSLPSRFVLLVGGLILGLAVGTCEELLRYGMLRWWSKDARSIKSGILLGIGYAGAGSIFLALLVGYNFLNMVIFRNKDMTTYAPIEQAQILETQIEAFWSIPWYSALRESIGQLFMMVIQISLTLIILQTFVKRKWYWILIAISFHTLVESTRIIVLNLSNESIINVVLGAFAIIGVLISYYAAHHSNASMDRS